MSNAYSHIPVSVLMETTDVNENQAAKVNQGGVWEIFQGAGWKQMRTKGQKIQRVLIPSM